MTGNTARARKRTAGNGNGNGHKATIVDVARQARVSMKTVSRVVNNEPNVRPDTRDRVRRAIEELNYQPNRSARGLAGNRSFFLGLLYESPAEFSYVKNALEGVIDACEAQGYTLLIRPCSEEPDLQKVEKFVAETGLDGAVLTAPICDNQQVAALLEKLDIPFAQLAPREAHPGWVSVQCNDEDASHAMTEYLLSLGHRRIGFIKGHPSHGATSKRLAGYRRCMAEHGLEVDDELVMEGYFDFHSGRRCGEALLALAQPPTAIFASNDDMAAGVMFAARNLGLTIPEDLSVAGFDDSPVATHTWPLLTTIKQPILDMAGEVTQRLIGQLRGVVDEGDEEVFSCELIVRDSTAARPAS